MFTDLFHALLERRNVRKQPLLSALLYEFCPQAAFLWRSGLNPQPVLDPVWQALEDYATGCALAEQLRFYELEDFSQAAAQFISDVQDFRSANLVRAPEISSLFTDAKPTAEEKRKFNQVVEKHFGGWDNLYAYIRTWAFLIGDWRLRSGITNEHSYSLRKTNIVIQLPDLGEPLYWQVWAWWVKVESSTTIHIGLLTPDGLCDPFRPGLVRKCSLEGDSPWPGGAPLIHSLNYHTGEVERSVGYLPDAQNKTVLSKLATIAESGPYPPLNMLRRPCDCQQCGFNQFCYNDERPTDLAWRGLEDVPAWQSSAR